jgi:hypothetical protein
MNWTLTWTLAWNKKAKSQQKHQERNGLQLDYRTQWGQRLVIAASVQSRMGMVTYSHYSNEKQKIKL